jgi:tRNA(fMet)-specific endonuclease VapC
MPYLLDTSIVSDLLRHPSGPVANRIAELGVDQIYLSIITAAELRYGIAKRRSPALSQRVEAALIRLSVLEFGPPADQHYAYLRARLELAGRPIGANDMLIAAHALAFGYVLVTDNVREFSRIPELKLENWLRN